LPAFTVPIDDRIFVSAALLDAVSPAPPTLALVATFGRRLSR
jgi:xanthosine utilization system XapX-like protein